MIRTAGWAPGSRANGSFPKGARRLSEKLPARHPPPHQPSPGGSASATPPQGGSDCPGNAGVPPASCPFGRRRASVRCCRQPPCRREQQRPGRRRPMAPFPVDPSAGDGPPGWCQAWCGRDARAPGKLSSHDIVTPRAQNCRSILAPLIVEAGPSVFWSICVYSCPFVVRLHQRSAVFPRMIRTAGWAPGSRANGSFPKGARQLSEKSPGAHPPPHQPSPGGSASATPPQGGSDCPGSAGVPPASCPFGRRRASVRCCRQPPCRREQQRPGRRRAVAPFPVDPSGGDGEARL